MALYIGLAVVVTLLALFVPVRNLQQGRIGNVSRAQMLHIIVAVAIFLLLAGVSACRIAVGNDYWVYRENFKMVYMGRDVAYEAGFNLIVYGMQLLFGYNNYLPIFGLFSFLTAGFMVKAIYDQGTWFAASVFLLMTTGYYYSSMNNVRYYFAIAILLYALKYIRDEKYISFTLWILFAALFHKTVLVSLVFVVLMLLAKIEWKAWLLGLGAAFVASFIFLEPWYREIIFRFYPHYEGSMFDNGETSIINILRGVAVVAFSIICYRQCIKKDSYMKFLFLATMIGFVINTFGSFIPEVTRIGTYFYVTQIFYLPMLILKMKPGKFRTLCGWGVGIGFVIYFAFFLSTCYEVNIRLLPYSNWIFN